MTGTGTLTSFEQLPIGQDEIHGIGLNYLQTEKLETRTISLFVVNRSIAPGNTVVSDE